MAALVVVEALAPVPSLAVLAGDGILRLLLGLRVACVRRCLRLSLSVHLRLLQSCPNHQHCRMQAAHDRHAALRSDDVTTRYPSRCKH